MTLPANMLKHFAQTTLGTPQNTTLHTLAFVYFVSIRLQQIIEIMKAETRWFGDSARIAMLAVWMPI